MLIYRLILWFAVAVALVIVAMTTSRMTARSYADLLDLAGESFDANNGLTSGAPQQAVVNGWYTNDLLTVIGKQNNTLMSIQGSLLWIAVILGLGVAAHVAGSSLIRLVTRPKPTQVPTPMQPRTPAPWMNSQGPTPGYGQPTAPNGPPPQYRPAPGQPPYPTDPRPGQGN
ncbi:hypothetical protein [Tessaracoccus lacteus]|uniref:Uncharacterized protein n=1 Tax=Tessaracoccus lacteus TaxID=3041766 RepID=A0ABY8PXU3_9ACTN|nr:hypothetical protein [Tessaracoccus sp. T21]WGT47270.1 hypothetical protein QH948_00305 [Tessaracoccus sp. T21]